VEHEHVAGGACGSNRAPAKRLKMARSFSVLLHFESNIYFIMITPLGRAMLDQGSRREQQ
jgi:hypothetical protein